ncbi:MAG: hypothetical protein HQM13_06705 [SAR324 cluster bacterium]|nr:hypothetical protein [SAR324 cluster bacterium]
MNETSRKNPSAWTLEEWNRIGKNKLPGLVGMEIVSVSLELLKSRLSIRQVLMAPNGFLHGASVVALADTSCGYGTLINLPD